MPQLLDDDDRQQIFELFARYAWSIDTRDIDAFVDCFAEDGAIEMPGVGRFVGRLEIRRYALMLTDDPAYAGRQHFIAQTTMQGDGHACIARSYGMVTRRTPDGDCRIMSMGVYDDRCTKESGRWLLAERVFRRWEPEAAVPLHQTG